MDIGLAINDAVKAVQDIPRKVRLKTGTVIGRLIIWAILVGILTIGWPCGYSAIQRLHTLQKTGKVVQATMVSARVSHGKSTSYYLSVSFEYDGVDVDAERMVAQPLYDEYSSANKLPVTVMPGNANNFEIGAVTDDVISATQNYWFWTLAICTGIVALLVWALEASVRAELRLMASGEATSGIITECTLQSGRSTSTNIRYDYPVESGTREGSVSISGDVSLQYPIGREIVVLYLRDRDTVSKPLAAFQFVDLAT